MHVTATPLSAAVVLARSAEVLVRHECQFKFGTDLQRVAELVSNRYDRGSGGKFITAYPRDDDHFRALATDLDRVTADLCGPAILSDETVRPGSLVHFRYGGFLPEFEFTDDGLFEPFLIGPEGARVREERPAYFSPPPWALSPLPSSPAKPSTETGKSVLLAGRFRITSAIRHANRGGVYRGTDERSGEDVIIKQARAHVGGRLDGTDARDSLREEARLLEVLAPLSLFPRKIDLLEAQGDLFLVQESVPGSHLTAWASERAATGIGVGEGRHLAGELVAAVQSVHRLGFVIRDLSPGNILITPTLGVRLIDPEIVAEPGKTSRFMYTPGFLAPELQEFAERSDSMAPAPDQIADCFSLGACLFHAVTGGQEAYWASGQLGHPRAREDRHRLMALIGKDHPALADLTELIVGLTETDPRDRWSLQQAKGFLEQPRPARSFPSKRRHHQASRSLDRLIEGGTASLLRAMTPKARTLWPPDEPGKRYDPCCASWGAAGVLATLTRAAEAMATPELKSTVAETAAWIDARLFDVPRLLPGLCYGRSGTAWALYDAAVLAGDDAVADRAIDLALALPTAGPSVDVTNGLSGAGFAHLHLWEASDDPRLLSHAFDCADSVLQAAQRREDDWLWPTSAATDSFLAGHSSYGFAHGIAGCGTFLLAAASAAQRRGVAAERSNAWLAAAEGAGETLERSARRRDGVIAWPLEVGGRDLQHVRGPHWCNGAVGIGTFLMRLGVATNKDRYLDIAMECVPSRKRRWDQNIGACCGLSGCGHFLLDLNLLTGDRSLRDQAEETADAISEWSATGLYDAQSICRSTRPRHNMMSGLAGVMQFLLRLRYGGPSPWMPCLPRLEKRAAAGHSGDFTHQLVTRTP